MTEFSWIMSGGGPLICAEEKYAVTWGGVSKVTVENNQSVNDYVRIGVKLKFLQTIRLQCGEALVFGQGPIDTSFWLSKSGKLYIIRIISCEEDVDFETIMHEVNDDIFRNPRETLYFNFSYANLIMFDSAWEGDAPDKKAISVSIQPGQYKILTQLYDPDKRSELILHRFDRIG